MPNPSLSGYKRYWFDNLLDRLPTPDLRALATVAMFALIFYIFWLVAYIPSLSENELFKTMATLAMGSGAFGLVCTFLWGGSKASVAAIDTVNSMANAAAASNPPPGSVTVNPPATVEVTSASTVKAKDKDDAPKET